MQFEILRLRTSFKMTEFDLKKEEPFCVGAQNGSGVIEYDRNITHPYFTTKIIFVKKKKKNVLKKTSRTSFHTYSVKEYVYSCR